MKKFLLVIAVIVALLGAGVAYVYVNIDSFIKTLIENIGSQTLGTSVTLDRLNLDLMQKSGAVSGLKIANPAGFSNDNMLHISSIETSLGDLKSDLITIRELNVGDTRMLLEIANKTTNLQTIMDNLPKGGDAQTQTQTPDIIIETVRIGQTTLEPKIQQISNDIGSITVPGFTLNNIGTAENGVTPSEAIRQILKPYLARIQKQGVQGQLMKKLPGDVTDIKQKLGAEAGDIKNKIESGAKDKLKGTFDKLIGE